MGAVVGTPGFRSETSYGMWVRGVLLFSDESEIAETSRIVGRSIWRLPAVSGSPNYANSI